MLLEFSQLVLIRTTQSSKQQLIFSHLPKNKTQKYTVWGGEKEFSQNETNKTYFNLIFCSKKIIIQLYVLSTWTRSDPIILKMQSYLIKMLSIEV